MVNSVDENGFEDEFCDFMFDSTTGKLKHELSNNISLVENKEWDKIAICTWLP